MKKLLGLAISLAILASLSRWIMSAMPGLDGLSLPEEDRAEGLKGLGNITVQQDVVIYQWTDEHGRSQYSSQPPSGQVPYETRLIKAGSNPDNYRPSTDSLPVKPSTEDQGPTESPGTSPENTPAPEPSSRTAVQ